jgi:hypothetical protein
MHYQLMRSSPENEAAAIPCRVCSDFCYGPGPDQPLLVSPDKDWPEMPR